MGSSASAAAGKNRGNPKFMASPEAALGRFRGEVVINY
jgi:hypothetical protein